MNIVAIVQARMTSVRLPQKVLKPICGEPMIGLLLRRLSHSKEINSIVVATSSNEEDDPLEEYVTGLGFQCYRGSEKDVLERYYGAAMTIQASVIVRITGDCPLIDPEVVDEVIQGFKKSGADYYSNTWIPTYPDGLDVEVFSFEALRLTMEEATEPADREHVTLYMRNPNKFKIANKENFRDLSSLRWTVDEQEDFDVISSVFAYFSPDINFSWTDVLALQEKKPEIFELNKHTIRNEGLIMNEGQKLWKQAKKIIPGGNMLLSKRAEMFLPGIWPSYFSKTKGCKIWDLEGNEYIDFSLMGVGTNILGYSHPEVDRAVQEIVKKGNMSTLNAPEEVLLAERLIDLHPWSDMVKFARSGGEANAVAIRIARAASGKDNVAICGYHGWHDWYLSANLSSDSNLDDHLLSGLEPNGVPRALRDTVFPFHYNNFEELRDIVQKHNIGVIKMEVERNLTPEDNFLEKIRKLATDKNIVLIFDECTSGFRETFGGLHLKYGIEPDMAIFGKALGNGYAISSILGRREVMNAAQSTFISSTFWTERIGTVAALKALKVMEKMQSWQVITDIGLNVRSRWKKLIDELNLEVQYFGIPALSGFNFRSKNNVAFKTFITQEMLKHGYLASNSLYACIDHSPDIISEYFEILESVFNEIKECEEGRDVNRLLKGPVAHSSFQRLN